MRRSLRLSVLLGLPLACGLLFLVRRCARLHLTPAERREDIEFLARWADAYSPFAALDTELRGTPDHREFVARYADLAEQATSDLEFVRIVYAFASILGERGHFTLSRGDGTWGSTRSRAAYWHDLLYQRSLVHPPFLLLRSGDEYLMRTDYEQGDVFVPRGSRVVEVDGMTSLAFLEHVRRDTWARLAPGPTPNLDRRLLLLPEGEGFRGWTVTFARPDGSDVTLFVEAKAGPNPHRTEFIDAAGGNCICVVLAPDVGYVRIKGFGIEHVGPDRETMHLFLARSAGSFSKLIIDLRHTPGGTTPYFYENLIKPFLDAPVSYSQVTGVRRRFLEDYDQKFLDARRNQVSLRAYEVSTVETTPPPAFAAEEWTFFEITRELEPGNSYPFDGELLLLVDRGTGSAADDYSNAMKRIGAARLVGQPTYGSAAAYVAPFAIPLPESGLEIVLEADILLNPDGSIDELVGTAPDVELPPAELPEVVTREALLEDPWIRAVLDGL